MKKIRVSSRLRVLVVKPAKQYREGTKPRRNTKEFGMLRDGLRFSGGGRLVDREYRLEHAETLACRDHGRRRTAGPIDRRLEQGGIHIRSLRIRELLDAL